MEGQLRATVYYILELNPRMQEKHLKTKEPQVNTYNTGSEATECGGGKRVDTIILWFQNKTGPPVTNPAKKPMDSANDAKGRSMPAENYETGFELWQVKKGTTFNNMGWLNMLIETKEMSERLEIKLTLVRGRTEDRVFEQGNLPTAEQELIPCARLLV